MSIKDLTMHCVPEVLSISKNGNSLIVTASALSMYSGVLKVIGVLVNVFTTSLSSLCFSE